MFKEKKSTQYEYSLCFIFLRLVVVNLYNNIRPGDTTHDDIQLKFKDYFTKFNRKMRIFVQASHYPHVQQLPCFILQVLITFESDNAPINAMPHHPSQGEMVIFVGLPYRWYISRGKNFTNFEFQKKIIHRKQKSIWFTPYF